MLSQILYISRSMATGLNSDHMVELLKITSGFFWGNTRPRVAWNILMQSRERAGLGVLDLGCYLWSSQLEVWRELGDLRGLASWKEMIWEMMQESACWDWRDLSGISGIRGMPGLVTRVSGTLGEL